MIRMMLMALGAYTLYRMYAPMESDGPKKILADMRDKADRATNRVRAAGDRS